MPVFLSLEIIFSYVGPMDVPVLLEEEKCLQLTGKFILQRLSLPAHFNLVNKSNRYGFSSKMCEKCSWYYLEYSGDFTLTN